MAQGSASCVYEYKPMITPTTNWRQRRSKAHKHYRCAGIHCGNQINTITANARNEQLYDGLFLFEIEKADSGKKENLQTVQ